MKEILNMEENKESLINIEQIKEEIKKIKLEIIEKENLVDELLSIVNNETEEIENS